MNWLKGTFSGNYRCLFWLGLTALVWAVQIFVLQELTFDSDYPGDMKTELVHCVVRLFLDLTFSAAVVFLLPRPLLVLTFVLYAVFFCGTCVYNRYFGAPPSLIVILAQKGEGATVWESVVSFLDPRVVLGTLLVLALELWLLWKAGRKTKTKQTATTESTSSETSSAAPSTVETSTVETSIEKTTSTETTMAETTSAETTTEKPATTKTAAKSANAPSTAAQPTHAKELPDSASTPSFIQVWLRRLAIGSVFLLVYLLVFSVLAFKVRPINGVGALNSFTDTGHVYGFIPAWFAEAKYSMTPAKQLELAIQRCHETSDQITPLENLVPLGRHVVVLQVESLDYEIIHEDFEGVPVMPFMRKLETESFTFLLDESHHTSSSADADFILLMGGNPIGRVCPYYVHDFPYKTEGHPLPRFAAQYGYQCDFLHNFLAHFFERETAIKQMGFRHYYFIKQMRKEGVATNPVGQNRIADGDMLDFATRKMNESSEPTIQFMITYSAHAPFNQLSPENFVAPFDKPTTEVENYFSTMNYFDRSMERSVQSLPDDTVLFIYADHASGIAPYKQGAKSEIFQPRLQNKTDRYIPAFVYCKGRNISAMQKTAKTGRARSKEFTLLDFSTFFRHCVENSPQKPQESSAPSEGE